MTTDGCIGPMHLDRIEKSHKTFVYAQPNNFPHPWGAHPNFSCLSPPEVIDALNSMDNVYLWNFMDDISYHQQWKKVHTLPLAYDSLNYSPIENDTCKEFDICFVGGWAKGLGPFIDGLGKMAPILKGLAWVAVIFAAYKSFSALASKGPLGVVAGIAASVAILAAGSAALNAKKADDAMFEGGGYGKRALLEKGSVTLFNDRDTIVAGTNINKRDAAVSPPAAVSEQTATDAASGGGGGGEPTPIVVHNTYTNDVFARTDKNAEDVYMAQTKSDGLFA